MTLAQRTQRWEQRRENVRAAYNAADDAMRVLDSRPDHNEEREDAMRAMRAARLALQAAETAQHRAFVRLHEAILAARYDCAH